MNTLETYRDILRIICEDEKRLARYGFVLKKTAQEKEHEEQMAATKLAVMNAIEKICKTTIANHGTNYGHADANH